MDQERAASVSADRCLHGEGAAGTQRRLALQGIYVPHAAIDEGRGGKPERQRSLDSHSQTRQRSQRPLL